MLSKSRLHTCRILGNIGTHTKTRINETISQMILNFEINIIFLALQQFFFTVIINQYFDNINFDYITFKNIIQTVQSVIDL